MKLGWSAELARIGRGEEPRHVTIVWTNIARAAYERYAARSTMFQWKLPPLRWEQLDGAEREGWEVAVRFAAQSVVRAVTR
jgi:hypothetical protein